MRRTLRYLAPLALLALASGWLLSEVQQQLGAPAVNPAHAPALLVDELNARRSDPLTGVVRRQLTARHAVQRAGDAGTDAEQVQITLDADDGSTWVLDAERAWVAADERRAQLRGTVTLAQPAGARPLTLRTRDVVIDRDGALAETAAAARIETPGATLEGEGMRLFLNEQRIELLSAVRGQHAPPPPRP